MIDISPMIIDLIIIGVAAEFLIGFLLLRRLAADHLIQPLFLFLLSGAFLMGALRLALSSGDGVWIGATLLGALVSHALLLKWVAQRCLPKNRS